MDTQQVQQPELSRFDLAVQEAEQKISPVVAEAEAIAAGITDQPGYERAAEYLKRNAQTIKLAKALLDPFVEEAHQLHQRLCDRRTQVLAPLQQKRAIVEPAAATYLQEQERRRREEEKKAQEAEKKRLEEEALRRAEAAAVAGDDQAADAILAQPIVAPKPVLPAAPRVKGIAATTTWSAEVTDLMALVRAVANGQAPLACLEPNMQVLNSFARSQKAHMAYPGVRAVPSNGLRVGGRAA